MSDEKNNECGCEQDCCSEHGHGEGGRCCHRHHHHHHHPVVEFAERPEPVSAKRTWECDGQTIAYTATAGHIDIREDCGKPIGSLFSVCFTADGPDGNPDPSRPVTFAFNGGPGSASVLINVGGIGPRRVVPNGDRRIGPAPFEIEDNPYTLLKESDLVFIDALGTGWSVMARGVKPERAFGIDNDGECFARAVCSWLEQTGRWNSPLYLFGESYGTTRNAVLCRELEDRGIAVNGVVMLSAIFDWTPAMPGNDVNYVELFPTFASIASYFGKCRQAEGVTLDELFRNASDFAEDKLAPALMKGDRLPADAEAALADEMADYLGLSPAYLRRKHLRVELTDFRQELLADEGKVCGRLDGRFTFEAGNFLQTSAEGEHESDPAGSATDAAWFAGFRSIIANEIGYHNTKPYLMSNWENVGVNWSHKHKGAQVRYACDLANVTYDLAYTMRHNPLMKVLVLGGRYDLATPFLGPVQDLSRMFLSEEAKKNLTFKLYDSGHMIYVNTEAFAKMAADVEEFYRA